MWIREHLYFNGFSKNYLNWIWHGEAAEKDRLNSSVNQEPTDNCHDDFETVNLCEAAYDNHTENPEAFMKFLEEAEKHLYKGCKRYTKLSALVKLYNTKARHGMSDALFSDLLADFGDMLPDNHNLPSSIYEAKKTLSCLALSHEKIHACSNDCILYRKQYKDCVSCPKCGLSRWKLTKKNVEKKGVPAKVVWYFPPIPRFKRMFKSLETSRNLTWHADSTRVVGQLRHPVDSPSWELVDHMWPDFGSEPGNDIDVYLEVLVDDLQLLWEGVDRVYDAYRREVFTLKAVLLWTINDFPAYGNLSGCTTHGYYACPICGEDTYAKHLPNGKKMSFARHRRFLPRFHPYRRQIKEFNGMEELSEAGRPLSGIKLFDKLSDITCEFGKKTSVKGKIRKKAKENIVEDIEEEKYVGATNFNKCWKKKSIFFNLPYWKYLHVRHCLDVMHIEKNIFESLINTLMNIKGKTKDNVAARLDIVQMGIRPQLAPKIGEKRTYLPPAACSFTKNERLQVCRSLMDIKVLEGFSSNMKNLVCMDEMKLSSLKSHDSHVIMQHFLPIVIRNSLPKYVRYAVIRLCFFFKDICCKIIDVAKLDKLQSDLIVTLCLLEQYFPPSFFDIMLHLTVHLVREVQLCGPVYFRWMYPFERCMKVLKSYVGSRKYPEGCIVRRYAAEEAVEFCSEYLNDLDPVGVPKSLRDPNTSIPGFSASNSSIIVQQIDLQQAHLTVLENTEEISPYIMNACQVAAEIDSCNGGMTSSLRWLAHGPRVRVLKCDSYVINGNLYQTKERDDEKVCQNSGVSLLANTMLVCSAKDKNPVLENVTFYGVIEEIWELDYHQFQVPLFKCAWVSNDKGIQYNDECGFTLVNLNKRGHQKDEFVLASQVRQVFYVADPLNKGWSIVLQVPNRCYEGEEDLWTIIPEARPIDNVDIHWKRTMRPKKQRKIAKYDEPRVVEDTELHQDADGLAAAELRGETEIEQPPITGQKKTRGPTSMCRLIAAARWGKKSTIEYDDIGRPVYNENGKALQSFIDSVVRSMVPINIKSWPTVPENMK
ncbi:uncharacterized protein LOC122023086 [Zingiber officinale]|uniref:uncharacterized protein LOC122023086 n=1 Tax=Zingiber officinale TaxID=94328 RepID=UPI001C4C6B1A|nr:uncharacterized protein LOC122023086 [Zingiber officinale]